MIIQEPMVGKFINMRSVNEDDAEFILKLRLDEFNSQFIGKTENDVVKQIHWIKQQKLKNNDYYFMFTDKENNKLGVISIYNMEKDTAESGRFVSFGNSVQNMEAVLMHYDFAYYELGINLMHYNVYKHNTKVVNMWKKLGSEIIREDKINDMDNYYFELTRNVYENIFKPKVMDVLNKINLQ